MIKNCYDDVTDQDVEFEQRVHDAGEIALPENMIIGNVSDLFV